MINTNELIDARMPDKISDCIMIALEDLAKVEKDKRYKVDMNFFHAVSHEGNCSVCFAGACMAAEVNDPSATLGTHRFNRHDAIRFQALDAIRQHDWDMMFHRLGAWFESWDARIALDEHFPDYRPQYAEDKAGFKQNMETVAAILAEHGF